MTRKELLENQTAIRKALDLPINPDLPEEVVGKLSELSALSGLLAECTAEAKRMHLEAMKGVIRGTEDKDLPASVLNKYIDANCATELADFAYCERLGSALAHSIDALRSIISWRKNEVNTFNHSQV